MNNYKSLAALNAALTSGEITKEDAILHCANTFQKKYGYAEDLKLMKLQSSLFKDEHANVFYSTGDDFVKVVRDSKFSSVNCHKNTAEKIAFFCARKNTWFFEEDFIQIDVEGQTVCLEYNSNDIFLWESDSMWHWSKEYTGNNIPDYHEVKRPEWWSQKEGMGVELELYCEQRGNLRKTFHKDLLGERDGSLNYEYGMEVIGGPYCLEDYQNNKTPWTDALANAAKFGTKGHDAGKEYGIHISITKSLFTPLHAAKFILFMNQCEKLCSLVSQRNYIYSGGYKTRKSYGGLGCTDRNKKKFNFETSKYEAVKVDDYRLEVRIFRANIRPARFIKNLEYCHAVMQFTKNAPANIVGDEEQATQAFLVWLNKSHGYHYLKSFLKESYEKRSNLRQKIRGIESMEHYRPKYAPSLEQNEVDVEI